MVPGVSTPGATVPPLCTVKVLLVEPDPPKTPPFMTVTSDTSAPEVVKASVPAMIVVGPA